MRPVLINALCVGSGGNATLARELPPAFKRAGRPCRVLLSEGRPLHDEIAKSLRADEIVWAPAATQSRWRRLPWERQHLDAVACSVDAACVLQLNGMAVSTVRTPMLCHMGDPWPYLPEAWVDWYNPLLAAARRRSHRKTLRRAARSTKTVVSFTSSYLRDLICGRLGIRPDPAPVFYNGIPDAWKQRAAPALPDERPPTLLTVGNVSPYKRQEMLIRAIPEIARRLRGGAFTYRIVGHCDERYREHLLRLIAELKLQGRVELVGRVSQVELEAEYRQARVMALLSVCESFGIPIVEAQSFGCATVVAKAGALPEVAGDGAAVTSADTPEAAARAVVQCLTDDAYARDLVVRGRRNINRFSWEDTAAAMSETISRLELAREA